MIFALVLLLILCVLLSIIEIYLFVRSINLLDDVRFIADVFRDEHQQTKYRSTPIFPVVMLLIIILCLLILVLCFLAGDIAIPISS